MPFGKFHREFRFFFYRTLTPNQALRVILQPKFVFPKEVRLISCRIMKAPFAEIVTTLKSKTLKSETMNNL